MDSVYISAFLIGKTEKRLSLSFEVGRAPPPGCRFIASQTESPRRSVVEVQRSAKIQEKNGGPFYEWVGAGLTSVQINGFSNGPKDLSKYTWTYKIGLDGEHLGIYKADGLNRVKWVSTSVPPKEQPLAWYKAVVNAPDPSADEPIGFDMIHMGKGLAWLNGEEVGR
ncbi:beta-galactosidase 10 [Actinidia rufa]|uniref:Beta-galactosidase 10 n=1 Tax=Actinidia rufa TaxID=165716 RepID=A0A7J0EY21_9ERIC|nr:beta-galactosidase 10 [Actinidia rufa]